MTHKSTRRGFLGTSALAMLATPQLAQAAGDKTATPAADAFTYEITRSDAEWRARLSEAEYAILRDGGTEARFSHDYALSENDGTYHCRGCDLPIYDAQWKILLPIGWVFFHHARPDTVLMSIDEPVAAYGQMAGDGKIPPIEAHCRRCGSHLGHILYAMDNLVHCINGTALDFRPASA